MIRYTVSAIKDKGNVRDSQQDALLILPFHTEAEGNSDVFLSDKANVFIVADGMGGTAGGEIASKLTVNTLKSFFEQAIKKELGDIKTELTEAISKANQSVIDYASTHPEDKDMGTTVLITLIEQNLLHVAWVGDSRCYGLRKSDSKLVQISKDHSYVQMLIDEGKLDPELAYQHPNRNLVTRSLGMKDLQVDYIVHELSEFSFIYLCSDGINSMIEDKLIEEIINQRNKVEIINKALVQAALDAGGHDNISSILIDMRQNTSNISIPYSENEYTPKQIKSPSHQPKYVLIILTLIAIITGTYFILGRFQNTMSNKQGTQQSHDNDTIKYLALPPGDTATYRLDTMNLATLNATDTITKRNHIKSDSTVEKLSNDLNLSYYIRLGVYPNRQSADTILKAAKLKFNIQNITSRSLGSERYEVCIINFSNQKNAEKFIQINNIKDGVILVQKNK